MKKHILPICASIGFGLIVLGLRWSTDGLTLYNFIIGLGSTLTTLCIIEFANHMMNILKK